MDYETILTAVEGRAVTRLLLTPAHASKPDER